MSKKKKTLLDKLIESGITESITETEPVIDLSQDNVTKKQRPARWIITISVPKNAEDILYEIDYKLSKLKTKANQGMKWYTGLVLFNTLLDYVDEKTYDPQDNICDYLLNKIKKELRPPSKK